MTPSGAKRQHLEPKKCTTLNHIMRDEWLLKLTMRDQRPIKKTKQYLGPKKCTKKHTQMRRNFAKTFTYFGAKSISNWRSDETRPPHRGQRVHGKIPSPFFVRTFFGPNSFDLHLLFLLQFVQNSPGPGTELFAHSTALKMVFEKYILESVLSALIKINQGIVCEKCVKLSTCAKSTRKGWHVEDSRAIRVLGKGSQPWRQHAGMIPVRPEMDHNLLISM